MDRYGLYVQLDGYIEKIKQTMTILKDINASITLEFKTDNTGNNTINYLRINASGLKDSIYIYIQHPLTNDKNKFKYISNNISNDSLVVNVNTRQLEEAFKEMKSDGIVKMYMYDSNENIEFIETYDYRKSSWTVPTIDIVLDQNKLYKMKAYNVKNLSNKPTVIMNTKDLNDIIKKLKKNSDSIIIQLSKDEITFLSNIISSPTNHTLGKKIKLKKNDNLIIDMKDKENIIIESYYMIKALDAISSINDMFYKRVQLIFIKMMSEDSYAIQLIYSGAGDKLTEDYIKITLCPCTYNTNQTFNNDNQINYN